MNTKTDAPKVKFKKKWSNPLYFIIKDLMDEGVTEFYLFGGKSSSKTISACQIIAIQCLLKKTDALIYRKVSANIKTTVKPSFKKSVSSTRLRGGYTMMDYSYKTSYGNNVFFKGLDNDEKVKGIEDFGFVLMDELNQFTKEDHDQALLSFRGEAARAFFGTWNPVSDTSWVKTDLIDKDEWHDTEHKLPSPYSYVKKNSQGNRALIKTTYWDNYWTVGSPDGTYGYYDAKLIAKYERLKEKDNDQYQVNVLGNWGTVKAGHEWLYQFNYSQHVRKVEYIPSLPTFLTFDFNVWPYMTMLCFQITKNPLTGAHVLRFYREYCLEHPRNSAKDVCQAWIKDYPRQYGRVPVKYLGDASGENRIPGFGDEKAFNEVRHALEGYLTSDSNMVYKKKFFNEFARDFLNDLLSGLLPVEIMFDEQLCPNTIRDIQQSLEDPKGGFVKEKVKDPKSGVVYEKNGHCVDALKYGCLGVFPQIYEINYHKRQQYA